MDRYTFRGKRSNINDPHKGEWIYGSLLGDSVIIKREPEDPFTLNCGTGQLNTGGAWIVDSKTVGQCTGLKDKNGKMVFEGDIAKVRGYTDFTTGAVVFNCTTASFVFETTKRIPIEGMPFERTKDGFEIGNYVVIGNVFDNQDLLEEEGASHDT